jgi:large subunit ribosomal protein L27
MSTHKAAGKARQHVRPSGKRLGVKVSDGQKVTKGSILSRQRGTKMHAGGNVRIGRDHTLFAVENGFVKFSQKLGKKIISVVTK